MDLARGVRLPQPWAIRKSVDLGQRYEAEHANLKTKPLVSRRGEAIQITALENMQLKSLIGFPGPCYDQHG